MWSQVVLCVLVGFAYAANNPAWNGNQEYIYKIHGRTLTGLEETSNQYSGILVRAQLRIQPRGDSKIQAVIENPEYSQIHSVLNDGWKTEIPDEEISWKSLPMSSKPFQVQMENGKVTNLKVSRDVNNWEANMIKAIMSLFQLNVKGDGTIASQLNTLPDAKSNSGIFYAMEDTVLGETATLYEIRSIPDYQLLDNEDEAHFYDMKQKNHPDGDVIEVFKHEDFSTNRELPAYNFGFGDYMRGNDPATNQMGKYFIRDSSSRAILAGNLNSHDVLFSESINTILVSPTITTQQKAAVISVMTAELKDIKSQDEKIGEINQPIELGNLVYSYNKPSAKDNQVERINNQGGKSQDSDEDDSREQDRNQMKSHYSNGDSDEDYDEDNNKYSSRPSYDRLNHRHRRSTPKKYGPKYYQNEDDDNDDDYYTQDKPRINEAPESPLLTYTTGYKGMFVKNAVEAVKEAEKIAKKIGSELKDKENDHHEETLERFVNLVSLIRTMDADELKQFANKFDSKSNEGEEAASWVAARDSIANAGTGPALLIVKEWIEKKKIEGNEASQVIADMATSARQPTLEYMKTFFKLVKSDKVSNTWPLNDTALITYTHLVRKVYVDKKISRSEYPENSFGTFRTSEGKKFVRKEVIPYLTQMLHKAVQRAETPKIHAYIRALGNTAEPRILNAFEPYLEGKKQASQFQRLLMVLSLGKLPETDPEVASAVFFRIAQNPAEDPAVRIAAILHLMRSNPSAQMLQTLASNTNVEDNEQVKAVVKHSIEELSELDGDEFMIIREKAKSARPLLTDDEYGFQNGANYLRSYIIDELMTEYKSSSQFIPSEDSYHPKGLRYTLRASLNGLYHKLAHMQAVVSSLDQLFDVAYKHTKSYSEEYKNQKQRAQEIQSNPWSSQNIAKILKMKPDEREQLEGFLYLEIGAPLRMLSFDNHTIGQLPENIRKLEESLNKGQKINNFRLYNYREMALAVPTVMGIPFLYTYDSPMLMKAQGQVKAVAQPQLSQNGKIQTPDNIKAEAEMKITVSGKTQGRVTFIAPFEHQQYIAGFDKHWELNLPKLKTEAEIDLNEQQIEAEFEIEAENKVKVAHYRTTPYTSKSDVTDFEPLSALKSTKPIESDQIQSYKQVFGRKSTGVTFEVEINHERQFIHLNRIVDAIYNNGVVDGLAELWEDGYIQHSMFEITYVPEKSSTRKIKLITNYDQEYYEHPKSQEPRDWRLDEKADPNKRQEELMDVVSAGINNADVVALDTVIHFEGDKNIQYLLTGASAKSYVDSTVRARICYKRTSEDNEVKDYELHLVAESDRPNTNGLDPEYALQNAPKVDSEIKLNFGPSDEEKTKIRAEIKHRRSEERKEYVEDSPMNEQCQQEMQKGNKQLDSCNNVTVEANLLDRIKVKLEYENLDSDLEDSIEMAYEATRMHLLPNLEIRKKQQSQESDEDGEISVEVRFHPDLAFVNISVETEKEETIARNIELNDLLRETFVAHPVFNLYDRLVGRHLYGVESYRDFCTVDQTHVNTFSNRTYEAKLSKQWTVMSIYVPREARDQSEERQPKSLEKQLQHQLENYVVLVRQNAQSDKKEDVKIVVSSPDTDYETVDIELKPSQGGKQKAQVSINGKQIEVSEDESEDIKDGYIQVYAIRNGEVKVDVHNNFYVLYDGSRVRMTALNGKLKDATRGLCGTFNDEDSDDFMTSETCVARQPKKFVKSFEVQGNEGEAVRQQFAGDENDCVEKEMPLYINVITARNAKRSSSSRDDDRRSSPRKQDYDNSDSNESDESDEDYDSGAGKKCLVHKTRYVEEGNKICFTTRPLPACRSECEPRGEQTKSVTVHCIQNNRVAQLWKDQIKNGGSPDFSNKKSHKTVQMSVPERCTA